MDVATLVLGAGALSFAGTAYRVASWLASGKDDNQGCLEICNRPDTGNYDLDICFVHGLTGGSRSTWMSRKTRKGFFWPEALVSRQLLATDRAAFPNARILLYKYNTTVHSLAWLTSKTLYYHVDYLLDSLTSRREGNANRPIIFVAHGLGGLLVKNALVEAQKIARSNAEAEETIDDKGRIYISTIGLVSFGVPYTSGGSKPLKTIIERLCLLKDPQMPKFEDFKGNNWWADVETLHRRLAQYNPLAPDVPEIICFESGKIENPISSKKLTLPPEYSEKLQLERNENHINMATFSGSSDGDFIKLCEMMHNLYKNRTPLLSSRKQRYDDISDFVTQLEDPPLSFDADFNVRSILPDRSFTSLFGLPSRQQYLKDIHTRLDIDRYAVIVGRRGMGKTSLAIQYAYAQHAAERDAARYSSIFWIDASSYRSLESNFSVVASKIIDHYRLGDARFSGNTFIHENAFARQSATRFVMDWLLRPGNDRWLLIYDNVEHSEAPSLRDVIPSIKTLKEQGGYVLVTSRSDHVKLPSTLKVHQIELSYSSLLPKRIFLGTKTPKPTPPLEKNVEVPLIKVEDLSNYESVSVLRSQLSDRMGDLEESRLSDLANRLDNVPEDIAFAGDYLAECAPTPQSAMDHLTSDIQIREEYSKWFDACVMLDAGPIPLLLLEVSFGLNRDEVSSALKALEEVGYIRLKYSSFDIPKFRLRARLQELRANYLHAMVCAERACKAVVETLASLNSDKTGRNARDQSPKFANEKESTEKELLEHVDACYVIYRDFKGISCEWDILAVVCEQYGLYSKAALFYHAARGQNFTNKNTDVQCLSQTSNSDGPDEATAAPPQRTAKQRSKPPMSPPSNDDLSIPEMLYEDTKRARILRNELGLIRMQVCSNEFEDLNLKPTVSHDALNVPRVDVAHEDSTDLEERCQEIMEQVKNKSGSRYKSLKIEAMRQTANVAAYKHEWLSAIQWNRILIAALVESYSPSASATVKAIENLAKIHMDQNDYEEAIPLLEQVLMTYEQKYEPNHEKALDVVSTLACAYLKHGELTRSRNALRRLVKAYTLRVGNNHVKTIAAKEDLARIYFKMGDHLKAEDLYTQALQAAECYGAKEHEEVLRRKAKLFAACGGKEHEELAEREGGS